MIKIPRAERVWAFLGILGNSPCRRNGIVYLNMFSEDNGIYCKIAGRTAVDILAEVAPKAKAIIAIGNCATFGGIQAAAPNPTESVGVRDLVSGTPVINVAGCPPNPIAFMGTVLHYLTFNRLPVTDNLGRPLFAYGRRIHDHCERRAHFDEARFAEQFGDFGHRNGYCLYKLGCKGPETFNNCPSARFNDVDVWPVMLPVTSRNIRNMSTTFCSYGYLHDCHDDERLGHNVVAGIIYVLTIIVALFQLASGFYLRLPENTFWQKVGVTLFGNQQHARFIHHLLMWYFIIFTVVHLYLVIWNELKHRDGLISSILSGNKFRPRRIK